MVAASVVPGVEVVVLGVAVVPGGDVEPGVVNTVIEKHIHTFSKIPNA